MLPGRDSIGWWAAALLLLARVVQGFSTGGEYAGAMTYLGEHSPDTRRGFVASWLEFGTLSGYILGAAVATIVTAAMPQEALLTWGWRLPFLVAGPLGLIGLYVRTRLEESPEFEKQEQGQADGARGLGEQLKDTLIRPWRALLICIGLVLAFNVTNYMLTQYMPTYLSEEVGLPRTPALIVVLAVMAVLLGLITFVARLSDRIGRKPILYVGCIGLLLVSAPAFLLVSQASYVLAGAGVLLIGLTLACFNSTLPSTLPALFGLAFRYGSLAIAFNVSVSLFGGTTPLVAAALVSITGSNLAPALLLILAGVIGIVSVYFSQETARRPLPDSEPSAASEAEAREVDSERRHRDEA